MHGNKTAPTIHFSKQRLSVMLRKHIASIRRDEAGATAILFAMCTVVLIGALGLTIDYGRAVSTRTKMQDLADAAGLAGAAKLSLSEADALTAAQQFAVQSSAKFLNGAPSAVTVTTTTSSVTVTAKADMPTTFMNVLGFKSVPIEVSAKTEAVSNSLDVFVVVDMSSSMGIGADKTERDRLKTMTKSYMANNPWYAKTYSDGCTFACHTHNELKPDGKTFREMARSSGIRLREDVVEVAVDALVDAVLDPSLSAVRAGRLKIGVIGFSNDTRWLQSLTDDKTRIKGAMPLFPASDRLSTRADIALAFVAHELERAKIGATKQKVILVTDGVSGDMSTQKWSEFDTQLCDKIKATGAELIVIETIYEEEKGDYQFNKLVRPFFTKIGPTMKACASTGAHYVASEPAEISKAFSDVAKKISQGAVRLTN